MTRNVFTRPLAIKVLKFGVKYVVEPTTHYIQQVKTNDRLTIATKKAQKTQTILHQIH